MSKQEKMVIKNLKLLYPNLKTEVPLNKITGVLDHRHYRVDIWIEEIRVILEIHGIQHFKPSGFGMSKDDTRVAFHDQMYRDSRLVEICKKFDLNYEQIDYNENATLAMLFKRFEKYAD